MGIGLAMPMAAVAETATATANSATVTAKPTLQDHSVEDMVAIAKTAQTNEALNDAVLNNDAIKETLGNDALPIPGNSQELAIRQIAIRQQLPPMLRRLRHLNSQPKPPSPLTN